MERCSVTWLNKQSWDLWSLTCAETLLQKADLLAERVDAVQLPKRMGEQSGFLCQALVQRKWEEAAEGLQHQLQLLQETGMQEDVKKDILYSISL